MCKCCLCLNVFVVFFSRHILPKSLHDKARADDEFERLLKDTKPVILYLHGNSGTRFEHFMDYILIQFRA